MTEENRSTAPDPADRAARDDVRRWRHELSARAKNGVNFILAAAVVWGVISFVWTLPKSAFDRSVWTFVSSSVLLPLAWLLSKPLRTAWTVPGNPLEPLGLWLNFAQLCYFPVLVYALLHDPDRFVMVFAVITGAHLFPYAWFYDARPYAVAAIVIPVGSLLLELFVESEAFVWIARFVAVAMAVLAGALLASWRRRERDAGARSTPTSA